MLETNEGGGNVQESPALSPRKKADVESHGGDENFGNDETKLTTAPPSLPLAKNNGVDEIANEKSDTKNLRIILFLWYICSAICTNTSISLNLSWDILTLSQLSVSSVCGVIGIYFFKLNGGKLVALPQAREKVFTPTIMLSGAFVMGVVTFNASLGMMHISSVMSLRALEPMMMVLISVALYPQETNNWTILVTLIPIVVGARWTIEGSGHAGYTKPSAGSVVTVLMCNFFFALRTILTKQLKTSHPIDDNNIFLHACITGTVLHGTLLVLMNAVTGSLSDVLFNVSKSMSPVLLLNGIVFYIYMQLSWMVMSSVSALSHSICASLRRPVICVLGWMVFGGASIHGFSGVGLVTLGILLYTRANHQAAKKNDVAG